MVDNKQFLEYYYVFFKRFAFSQMDIKKVDNSFIIYYKDRAICNITYNSLNNMILINNEKASKEDLFRLLYRYCDLIAYDFDSVSKVFYLLIKCKLI